MKETLLIGIGNQGRGDDGLGWAFADRVGDDGRFEVVRRYQLQVEDAELISRYKEVWFVDASHEAVDRGFSCEPLRGQGQFSYTTHSLHPEAVLQLCHQLYGQRPKTRLLGISGDHFELGRGLSEAARERLEKALAHFREAVGPPGTGGPPRGR